MCRCFLLVTGILVATPGGAQQTEEKELGGKKLRQWIAEIRHNDPGVRENAIRAVALFGKEGRRAGKALISELRDADPSLRSNAAIAIATVGLDADDVDEGVKGLGRLVQTDSQASVRVQAALALVTFGAHARPAVPQLAAVFRDSSASWEVRRAAAIALGSVAFDPKDGPHPEAINALTSAVRRDVCTKVRLHALTALILLGKGPAPVEGDSDKLALRKAQVEALRTEKTVLDTAVKDPDKLVSLWARVALMRIDKVTEAHLIQIGLLLRSADLPLRINAAQALGAIGSEAKSQVPNLIAALKDSEPEAAAAAALALGGMGDDAHIAIPSLKDLAEGKNEVVKAAAKEAIARISNTNNKNSNTNNKNEKPAGK
jgi:HEAT repeat protein